MQTQRWKVFDGCIGWLAEARTYHRRDGRLVKLHDDRISASRYALMMLRFATTRPTGEGPRRRNLKGVVA